MTALTAAGVWLLQAGRSLPDTIVTVQAKAGTFQTVTSIASGLMSVALLVLTVALVPAAWNFRRSYKRINELLDRVYGDINPIVRHISTITDNVDYITSSVRVDIQQVNQTIAEANQRLNHALALSEQRLNEFNALLQVVQQEAEGAFVSTASTLRGVRTGAAFFRDDALLAGRGAGGALDAPGADFDAPIDDFDEEIAYGDDSAPEGRGRLAGPRIRPRPRGDIA